MAAWQPVTEPLTRNRFFLHPSSDVSTEPWALRSRRELRHRRVAGDESRDGWGREAQSLRSASSL